MDPIATQIIKKMDEIATPAIQGFLPILIDKMTGFKISQWSAQGKQAYEKDMIEWEKEKSLIMAFNQAEISRKVNNFLSVAEKANKYIDPSKEFLINDNNDVFWGLLEHSKTISNEEVQELIAKIIAGEYNNPGSYSMSTLQVLKSLGKNELQEFEKLAGFTIDNNDFLIDFFSTDEIQNKLRIQLGLDYKKFIELQNLGLIQTSSFSFKLALEREKIWLIKYMNRQINCKCKIDQKNYNAPGRYSLTKAGTEIIIHLNPKFSQEFYDWLKSYLNNKTFEVLE